MRSAVCRSSLQSRWQRRKGFRYAGPACLLVAGILGSAAASAVSPPVPAYWAVHDEIAHLENLPKPYSCDELYYILQAVLEEVGARPGARILPFGCSGTPGTSSTEPTRVELRYELPKPLAVTAPASVMATLSTVRLTPGHPSSLHPDDCQLVKDLTTTLLPSIGSHIESNHLNCAGVQGSSPGFSVTLQAWKAVSTPARSTP